MPWKENPIMNQKIEFAIRSLSEDNFSDLCREFGISRKTGYKWKERYQAHGAEGLSDVSRRPKSHAKQLDERTVCEIVRLKQAHMKWGPKKIHELYRRKHGLVDPPSLSSMKRVLSQAGLTEKRRRRSPTASKGRLNSGRVAENCNDVWTIDFKGWWRDQEGLKVEPLTVRDEWSRFLFDIRLLESCRTASVKKCFEALFKEYGLPKAIRSDNGSPFASSQALLGLSRLSAWWLSLGIELERGRPGCPQDNGGHERMHLDIWKELQKEGIGYEQSSFDMWRKEYNTERPHESLGMKMPAEIYEASPRPYQGTPEELAYPGMEVRKVNQQNGTIQYEKEVYKLTASIGGWTVGLKRIEGEKVEVWFAKQLLGQIDEATRSFVGLVLSTKKYGDKTTEEGQ